MATDRYDYREVETRWQREWTENGLFLAPEKPVNKAYVLEMFAYPSGDIHLGHFRNYSIGDAVARFRMMQGNDLLHPFGWDAFGLPAENAAIDRGIPPGEWTERNITTGRQTLIDLGISYDWQREVVTCRPDYYRWSQWLFLLLHERGLAYRASSFVNWCPSCKTVLANEQVVGGECERCDSTVEKRDLEQWFFRTTAYAQQLLDGLDRLPGWPDNIKAIQRNWIGRSEGCRAVFAVRGFDDGIEVFTTRPDTLYGVTFMAVAPESPWARHLAAGTPQEAAVDAYIRTALARSDIDRAADEGKKDGVDTGRTCVNPLSGDEVRIFVADYVLAGYGSGAVMGVPAHDQRDLEFARAYDLPIRVVIRPEGEEPDPETMEQAYAEPGTMVNSGPFDGVASIEGKARITEKLAQMGSGGPTVQYRLHDWLISRQRYWGTPIPMIHCDACGVVPVPESDLPVLLPENVTDFLPKGRSPLADVPEFMEVACPKCEGDARRDADTMDTFMCSAWYHLRYADARNDRVIFDREKADAWLPIDIYIGGAEHATGHLIYFRFMTKVLRDAGYLSCDEPALVLINHGMVQDAGGRKMSKRTGNLVSPQELMKKVGIDAARIAMFFFAPSTDPILWNDEAVHGARRFLDRVWDTATSLAPRIQGVESASGPAGLSKSGKEIRRRTHEAIRRVTDGLAGDLKFNTGIAALMELVNALRSGEGGEIPEADVAAHAEAIRAMTKLFAPLAPHLAEELYHLLGGEGTVFRAGWPEVDPSAAVRDEVEIAVQVNGKVRGRLNVAADIAEAEVLRLAREDGSVARHLEGKEIVKQIYVPGRLVSLNVKE